MNAFNGAPYILDTFLNKFLKNKNKIFFRRFLSSTPIFTPKRTFDI